MRPVHLEQEARAPSNIESCQSSLPKSCPTPLRFALDYIDSIRLMVMKSASPSDA